MVGNGVTIWGSRKAELIISTKKDTKTRRRGERSTSKHTHPISFTLEFRQSSSWLVFSRPKSASQFFFHTLVDHLRLVRFLHFLPLSLQDHHTLSATFAVYTYSSECQSSFTCFAFSCSRTSFPNRFLSSIHVNIYFSKFASNHFRHSFHSSSHFVRVYPAPLFFASKSISAESECFLCNVQRWSTVR